MITKGIVEKIIDPYTVRVRIPLLDRMKDSTMSTSTDNLSEALICSSSGSHPNLSVGDVVIVSKDDQEQYLTILGHLYRPDMKHDVYQDQIFNKLEVYTKCTLPVSTTIGALTYEELLSLKGVDYNVHSTVVDLKRQNEELSQQVKALNNTLNNITSKLLEKGLI